MTNPPTPIHVHMVYGCPLIWYIFLIALYWRLTWLGEQVNPLKVTVVWHHFPWIITNKRWSWPQQPSWWYDYQFIYQLENDYTIYYIKATQTSCSFILLFHENSRWIWAKKEMFIKNFQLLLPISNWIPITFHHLTMDFHLFIRTCGL